MGFSFQTAAAAARRFIASQSAADPAITRKGSAT
jgi:hypothetical protein